MTDIRMSSRLPQGDGNGLVEILSELVRDQQQTFVTIALIDGHKVSLDKDTGEKVPVARIRRIEVILDPEDRDVCRRLLERALSKRSGRETLPYDLQAELEGVFGAIDPATLTEDPE